MSYYSASAKHQCIWRRLSRCSSSSSELAAPPIRGMWDGSRGSPENIQPSSRATGHVHNAHPRRFFGFAPTLGI